MNTSEKLRLNWNDFKDNISHAFGDLRKEYDLLDVTLACEDGQVEAHKVVLASLSPLFKDIFQKNKHAHPVVYMKGFKSSDLSAVLDFIYFGEANVYQDNLDSFLALAEELKLKGLTGTEQNESNDTVRIPKTFSEPKREKSAFEIKNQAYDGEEFSSYYTETSSGKEVALNSHKRVSVELEQLDEQINSMMEQTENQITMGGRKFTAMICKVCGKEARKVHMKEHIEAYHITGVTHACDVCGTISRSRSGLRTHKFQKHRK